MFHVRIIILIILLYTCPFIFQPIQAKEGSLSLQNKINSDLLCSEIIEKSRKGYNVRISGKLLSQHSLYTIDIMETHIKHKNFLVTLLLDKMQPEKDIKVILNSAFIMTTIDSTYDLKIDTRTKIVTFLSKQLLNPNELCRDFATTNLSSNQYDDKRLYTEEYEKNIALFFERYPFEMSFGGKRIVNENEPIYLILRMNNKNKAKHIVAKLKKISSSRNKLLCRVVESMLGNSKEEQRIITEFRNTDVSMWKAQLAYALGFIGHRSSQIVLAESLQESKVIKNHSVRSEIAHALFWKVPHVERIKTPFAYYPEYTEKHFIEISKWAEINLGVKSVF